MARPTIIAIGASTGGPMALRQLLSGLGPAFALPILVVQHIAPGFVHGFAEWLSQSCNLPVGVASNARIPDPGQVYIAPDHAHLGLNAEGGLSLAGSPPEAGLRPAVSYLFRSVTAVHGARAIGILLSGMGVDGAAELRAMKDAGATTIAQSPESSIIHGMPGAAIALGGACHVLEPAAIAPLLRKLLT